MVLVSPVRNLRGLVRPSSLTEGTGADGKPVSAQMESLDLADLFSLEFPSDAHFVTYDIHEGAHRAPRCPRLKKESLPLLRELGGEVLSTAIVLDLDLKDLGYRNQDGSSKSWNDLTQDETTEALQVFEAAPRFTAAYTTLHGFRFIHALALAVPAGSGLEALIKRFFGTYSDAGLPVDRSCKDWTRLFRAPRVTREDGSQTWTQPWYRQILHFEDTDHWYVPTDEDLTPVQEQTYSEPSPAPGQPSQDEAEAMVWEFDDKGRRKLTQEARKAKQALKASPLHAYIFEGTPFAMTGGRHNALAQQVGTLVKFLRKKPFASRELLFGLVLEMVKMLDQDEDWAYKAWNMVTAFWSRDESVSPPSSPSSPSSSLPSAPSPLQAPDEDLPPITTNDEGVPYNTRQNWEIALRLLQVYLWRDEFSGRDRIETTQESLPSIEPGNYELTDDLELALRFRLEDGLGFKKISPERWHEFINHQLHSNRRHTAREYFDSLQWDGIPRIQYLLPQYFGAEAAPIHEQFGHLMMVAAVRRVRQPGCKFDEVLVLEGPQGGLKSSALRSLCPNPNWFLDDLPLDADAKVVIEQTRGKLFVELAELTGHRRATVDKVKAMLSRQTDRARAAYGRRAEDVPRQFVFFASTNDANYLRDLTGNRRFWPVQIGTVDIRAIEEDRDQLWAEAATLEASGVSIRLDPRFYVPASEIQSERAQCDPYYEMLVEHVSTLPDDCMVKSDDLWKVFGIRSAEERARASSRFGEVCKKLDLHPRQVMVRGARAVYRVKDRDLRKYREFRWNDTAKKFIESRGTPAASSE